MYTDCGFAATLLRFRARNKQNIPSKIRAIPTAPPTTPIAILASIERPDGALSGGEVDTVAPTIGSLAVRDGVDTVVVALKVEEVVTSDVLCCDDGVSKARFEEGTTTVRTH